MDIQATGTGRNGAGTPGTDAGSSKEVSVKRTEKSGSSTSARRGADKGNENGSSGSEGNRGSGTASRVTRPGLRGNGSGDGRRSAEMMKMTTGATRATRAQATARKKAVTKADGTAKASTGNTKNRSTAKPVTAAEPKTESRKRVARTPATKPPAAKPSSKADTPTVVAPKAAVSKAANPKGAGPKTAGTKSTTLKPVRIPTPEELAAETVARALRGPRRVGPATPAAHAGSVTPVVTEASAPPDPPDRSEDVKVVMDAHSPHSSPVDPPMDHPPVESHADAHAGSYAESHPSTHTNAHAESHADVHTDSPADSHRNSHAESQADADAKPHTDQESPPGTEPGPAPGPTPGPSTTDLAAPSADYPPFFGELDLYLTGEGKHFRLWEKMGAHPLTVDGVAGVVFAVWAPNAEGVSVVGAFNQWDGRRHPMRGLGSSGIWFAFVPDLTEGDLYKYEIRTREGHLRIKSDPYAFFAEVRPASASAVWDVDKYTWGDQGWMESRRNQDLRHQPMNVYEMHLASWMRAPEDNDRWLNYRELAPRLVDHLRRYSFTHVELLPVAEHLLDQSWGYQVTGYFAPTSRHGTPDDFKYLVDLLHQNGIGIIIDWVPAHFPKDESGLRWFDGTALYEHADPRQGEHRDWGTLIFNYGRHEVRNFLLANALFWLDVYHIDGLRVDAVASMLYLDYSRDEGDWLPNRYGGRENIEAIEFVRKMNELVYGEYPGAFTIAEESTDWGGVTMPTYLGGLGFGFKWDMGWMHDTLLYFSKEPVHRAYHHNDLTFAMLYAYTENFIMPLSHDEVVHGKGSLLGKMPGDDWQRFANLRALYAYLFTRPGKKLLFMGAEFAQSREWRSDNSLDWHLTEYAPHKGIELLLEDLGRLYRSRDALWAWDTEPQGYQWIDCSDSVSSVLSYLRRGPTGFLVTVLNLTPVPRIGYRVGVPDPGYYREILNTDSELYGGGNLGNGGGRSADGVPMHGQSWSLNLTLPPLAAVVFELAR